MPTDNRSPREMRRRPFEGHADDDPFAWEDMPTSARPHGVEPAPVHRASRFDAAVERFSDARREPAAGLGGDVQPEVRMAPEQPLPRLVGRRRRASAGAVLAAMLVGFFIAGLLDARGIQAGVKAEQLGSRARSVQLALLEPMVLLSGALRLDRPAAALNAMLGRGRVVHHYLADVKTGAKPKWPRHIALLSPLRLYIVGDSMAQVFGSSLKNASEGTHLVIARLEYRVSSGLSRPDFFNWPQELIDELVSYNPDATAVLFGANDAQNVMYRGKVLKVGTGAWQTVYGQRVGAAMHILTRGGRRVYWVGNPVMRDAGYSARIAMMNAIYQAQALRHPGVTFVNTWSLMANRKGKYSAYLTVAGGDKVLMRAGDGVHLTRAGGDRMAVAVLRVIERDWGMPTTP